MTKPPSKAIFRIFFFFTAEPFFLVNATVKTRPVLKRGLAGRSNDGSTKWNKSWGHDEKIIFLRHDSEE